MFHGAFQSPGQNVGAANYGCSDLRVRFLRYNTFTLHGELTYMLGRGRGGAEANFSQLKVHCGVFRDDILIKIEKNPLGCCFKLT